MRFLPTFILTVMIAFATMPAQAGEAQRTKTLKDNMEMAAQLEDIAAPVLTKNSSLCGSYTRPYIGAEFMTIDGVGEGYKSLVTKHYGVGEYPTVTIVGKSSPAHGRMKTGDVIVKMNGKDLKKGNDGQYAVEDEIAKGHTLELIVNRGGEQKKIEITPAHVCGAQVRLDASGSDKIWAESGKVFVSKGALRSRSKEDISAEIKTQLSRYKK